MEKLTETTNYRFGDDKIEVMPYFLYEVTIYHKLDHETESGYVNGIGIEIFGADIINTTNKK